jgi:hypothetical protein
MPDLANIGSAAGGAQPGDGTVVGAIRQASAESGVDFSYLLQKASTESGLNPNARAATSSASGLFQFIDQTWMTEIAEHGAQYGLKDEAFAVSFDTSGRAHIDDPAMRREIMNLKNDPRVAAEMAAEFTKDNQAALQQSVGGRIGSTELYLAHFLGAGGAAKFLQAYRRNPGGSAEAILPEAADANEAVFYHADGSARSLGEIYNRFAAKFSGGHMPAPVSAASYATAASAYAGYTSPAFANPALASAPASPRAVSSDANDTAIGNEGRASLYEMLLLNQLSDIERLSGEAVAKPGQALSHEGEV